MPGSGRNKPVVWTDQAKKDLERIFDHVSDHFSQIMDEVESLSEFPRKGAISSRFNEIRELIVDSNTIYYRNNESDIVIASIRPRRTAPKR